MKYLYYAIIGFSLFFPGCKSKSNESVSSPGANPPQTSISVSGPEKPRPPSAKEPKQPGPSFYEAAFDGDINKVTSEIEAGIEVNAKNPDGQNVLMLAAFNGHTAIVKLLLEKNAKVNELDPSGRTALIYASCGPNAQTVQLLIEHDAELNIADVQEKWTALMFAASEGQADVVRILLENGADTQLRDIDGDTAYNFAVQKGYTQAAELLETSAPD